MTSRKPAHADQLAHLAPAATPADADRPEAYPERILLKVPADMKRDLELAKVEDRIEISARIRAMISLWRDGGEFRADVDRRARTTGRPKHT
jgi:hypothetical protein